MIPPKRASKCSTHPLTRQRGLYTRWTLEADLMLLELYRIGASMREMTLALNRSAPKIRSRLARMSLKLSDRGSTPNRQAFDAIMVKHGLPARYTEEENA